MVKRYLAEPGSESVQALLGEADEVTVSELLVPELISTFKRNVRDGLLDERKYQALKSALQEDLREVAMQPIDGGTIAKAISCLEGAILQGCDSIHVATALQNSCDLFVSADQQQIRAAKKLGLAVKAV